MKTTKIFFVFYITLLSLFLIPYSEVIAINMDSNKFKIQFGNVNVGAKSADSDLYKLSTTVGQTAAGKFSSQGYIIKAGFQYIHSIIPFTFSVSNTQINLGLLNPNNPATATTDLTVSFGSAGSYQVTAIEETPLKTLIGVTIPDTSCNGGANVCDESVANLWNSNGSYGFGYQATGQDIPQTYTTCQGINGNNCYRRFPDRNSGEIPVVVMSSNNVTEVIDPNPAVRNKHLSTITFKANISNLQGAGSYQNTINFIATPGY